MWMAWRKERMVALAIACTAVACAGGGDDDSGGAAGTGPSPIATVGSGGSTPIVAGNMNPASGSGGRAPAAGSGGQAATHPMAASGSGGATTISGSGGSSAPAVPDAGANHEPSDPMRLAITAKAVPASGEDHVCVTLAAPNAETAWVTSIHATLTVGSHHLIVDRLPVGTALKTQTASCAPTMGGDSTRLIIAQQRDTVLDTPKGTAFRLEPHQPIFLQLHYINLADAPADIEGAVELELADVSAGTPIEVQSLFTGAMAISLSAGQPGLAEFFMSPQGTASKPLQIFALTSHTHSLGVDSTIERVPNANAPDSTPVHESLDWHEPPLTTFDPPLQFSGQDGLRLRCHYQNTTDHDVHFGTRFEDEMCFMWMYFYEQP
jgi:hypothetical protein